MILETGLPFLRYEFSIFLITLKIYLNLNTLFILDMFYLHNLSRCYSFGVSREQGTVSNVFKTTIQHHNSLQSNTSSTMRESSIPKAVDIVLNCLRYDSTFNSSFFENFWVMNSLSSTQNLFSSHEEIIRAGKPWIILT